MSAILAIAIKTIGMEMNDSSLVMDKIDLPDFVKENMKDNLIPYLRAIQLDGYETYKKRKMMIVGNTRN